MALNTLKYFNNEEVKVIEGYSEGSNYITKR